MVVRLKIRPIIANTNHLKTVGLMRDLENITVKHARKIVDVVKTYPAPVGGTYIRTFALFKGWKIKRVNLGGNDIVVRIYNEATDPRGQMYAELVHGPKGVQYRLHGQRGWKRLDEELMKDDIINAFKAAFLKFDP